MIALVACSAAKTDGGRTDSMASGSSASAPSAASGAPSPGAPSPGVAPARGAPPAASLPLTSSSTAKPSAATAIGRQPDLASACGQRRLDVIVRSSAFADGATPTESAMRAVTAEILAPVRGSVVKTDVSPAIRAFRIELADTAAIDRVAARIRASGKVEDVSPDNCSMRAQQPRSTSPPTQPR